MSSSNSIHLSSVCNCDKLILIDYKGFKGYQPSQERLGSVFDDFFITKFKDENGEIHEVFYHNHVGPNDNYLHPIPRIVISETWIDVSGSDRTTLYDNVNVIPKIKELLTKSFSLNNNDNNNYRNGDSLVYLIRINRKEKKSLDNLKMINSEILYVFEDKEQRDFLYNKLCEEFKCLCFDNENNIEQTEQLLKTLSLEIASVVLIRGFFQNERLITEALLNEKNLITNKYFLNISAIQFGRLGTFAFEDGKNKYINSLMMMNKYNKQ